MSVFIDVEARDHRDDGAALELDHPRQMGGDIDRIAVVGFIFVLVGFGDFRAESAVFEPFGGHSSHAFGRTKQIDQSGAVIRTEIQHRTCAVIIEERSLSPLFGTASGNDRRSGKRLSDPAVVEQFAGGLLTAAEIGIRSAADAEPFLLRQTNHLLSIFKIHSEGFFRIGVFARVERVYRDLGVNLRRRQIDDDLDIGIGKQLLVGDVCHAVEFMFLCGPLRNDIGARDHFKIAEFLRCLEVRVGNHSASDNTDLCRFHVLHRSCLFIAGRQTVFHHELVALFDCGDHLRIAVIQFDDHRLGLSRSMSDQVADRQSSRSERHQFHMTFQNAVDHLVSIHLLGCDAVLHVQEDRILCKEIEHLDRVFRSEVRGPEAVDFIFHVRAEFTIDFIFEFAVDALELEIVVVLEKGEAVAFGDFNHIVGVVSGALDRIHVFEVIRAVAADDLVKADDMGDVHCFADGVAAGPRRMRGVHLQAEVGDDLHEFGGTDVPEAGGLHAHIADVGNPFQDAEEILAGGFAKRIQLDGQRFQHNDFLLV